MKNIKPLLVSLFLMLSFTSGSAQAGLLLGQHVSIEYFHPNFGTLEPDTGGGVDMSNILVSNDVEILDLIQGVVSLDIRDQQLFISFLWLGSFHNSNFNGIRMTVLSDEVEITSVTIDAISNLSGFGIDRIEFDADQVVINWAGLTFLEGQVLALNLNAPTQTVPEPLSLSLFGMALFGMFALRRKA